MYDYIEGSGVIITDTSTIQENIVEEYKTAFNDQSLVTTPDTPQGALVATETIARTSLIANNAKLANQINPEIAAGIFLDAIGALTNTRTNRAIKNNSNSYNSRAKRNNSQRRKSSKKRKQYI